MQLGFVSAILADRSLEDVLAFAAGEGFVCVELMCWPPGAADRRYAGVTHLDVTDFTDARADAVRALLDKHGVAISGLGYYPNPLDADPAHRRFVANHLKKVIDAAAKLGVGVVNTFIGRDHALSLEGNWPRLLGVWPEVLRHAEAAGIRLGIENCPMLFSRDEWPGGKNLAVSPAIWRVMFDALPSPALAINFDPSHLLWQRIDAPRFIREFAPHLIHVHAKDERIDPEPLYERGILGVGWHVPCIPGRGEVSWAPMFAALKDVGYAGPVCVEVEDRDYEGSLADRQRALRESRRFLEQFEGR
jgi:sugar phosphate isomerase/epimerase